MPLKMSYIFSSLTYREKQKRWREMERDKERERERECNRETKKSHKVENIAFARIVVF